MTPRGQKNKNSHALIAIAGFAALLIVFGLLLIFVPNNERVARQLSDAGAVYLIEASKSGADEALLQKSYDLQRQAIQRSPYDAALWVRLAYAAQALNSDTEKVRKALEIAHHLDPQQDIAAHELKLQMLSGGQ